MKRNIVNVLLVLSTLCFISCSGRMLLKKDRDPKNVLQLTPSENNPRNSEGDFVTLKDGRIMFVYNKFYGESGSDFGHADLVARFSDDGGNTWTDSDKTIVKNDAEMSVRSVSLLRLQNDVIGLFYMRQSTMYDNIPHVRFSNDEGQTWSDPIRCINDKKGYFVLNNDRVIQLENGRLLLPVSLHLTPKGEHFNSYGEIMNYYSDDNGLTWKSGKTVENPKNYLTQEPGLIELTDGKIMMFVRSDIGRQLLSYSDDNGVSWEPWKLSNIISPVSPTSIERIPRTGDLVMVWNNNDGSDAEIKGKRTPLSIAISKDEGLSWIKIKNLEEDKEGWYCYTAIHFTKNDDILLGYCAGSSVDGTGLAITDITSVPLKWVYE